MRQTGYCPRGPFCAFAHVESKYMTPNGLWLSRWHKPIRGETAHRLTSRLSGWGQVGAPNTPLGLLRGELLQAGPCGAQRVFWAPEYSGWHWHGFVWVGTSFDARWAHRMFSKAETSLCDGGCTQACPPLVFLAFLLKACALASRCVCERPAPVLLPAGSLGREGGCSY